MLNIERLIAKFTSSSANDCRQIKPAELLTDLQKVLTARKKIFSKMVCVPDNLTAHLSPVDMENLATIKHSLEDEFSCELAAYCQKKGWRTGKNGPFFCFEVDRSIQPGTFRIDAVFSDNFHESVDELGVKLYARWVGNEDLFNLSQGSYVIGRGGRADITINDNDLLISQQHCRITVDKNRVWVEDLHSSNGTWLNNQRLTNKQEIKYGDLLKIGNAELMLGGS